jgi:prepilin-type N-terminal cleavage/methylation domain-containing protein
MGRSRGGRAFTLIELLVVVSIVALVAGLLVPSLSHARGTARQAACLSNQRQLVTAWTLYAQDHKGFAMPLADENGAGEIVYWWGQINMSGSGAVVEHARGAIAPYLDGTLAERSVFECPAQPWGTYRAQPAGLSPAQPTSTYGYNGYGLCPPATPGWNQQIGTQRWKTVADVERPSELFVFADTLLAGSPPRNCALLDPPRLFSGGAWTVNPFPTTCFRHSGGSGSACAAAADGSGRSHRAQPEWLTAPAQRIGSAGLENDPHYIQEWRRWR